MEYLRHISSGQFISSGPWIHPDRCITSNELIVVTEGVVFIEEDSSRFTLRSGDVVYLRKNHPHRGFQVSEEKTSFYWVHFEQTPPFSFRTLTLSDPYPAVSLLRQLLHYANTPTYPAAASDLTLSMLAIELSVQHKQEHPLNLPLLAQICEWIRMNSNRRITLDQLSTEFGYQKDYLSRIFRMQYREGLKRYIDRMRMNHIKNLLLTTSYPLKAIAGLCGFDDARALEKYFKYQEKITPTVYRSQYWNTHQNQE